MKGLTFLIYAVCVQIVQDLMYHFSACLLYLIVSPKHKNNPNRRQTLFIGLGALLISVYMLLEDTAPTVYALHMFPISLLMATLYNETYASVISAAVLVMCGVYWLGGDWISLAGGALIWLCAGFMLKRKLPFDSIYRTIVFSVVVSALYLIVYSSLELLGGGERMEARLLAVLYAATLLSSVIITFIYYFVQNQVRLQRELNMSEKYQTIGQLAASISHEIRNPLTTTRGFLQLMNVDKLSKENFERYRKYAFEGLDHANAIITDYLNFSKPTSEAAIQLNVKDQIEGVVLWLQPYSVQNNVSIVTHHMAEESLHIKVQPKQFQQCVLNIMKNAIESMPTGGLLTVHTRVEQDQVQILIRDTGVGMSGDQLKQIGLPYFSTKESGTGLGLMVVLSLVKAMNGKIFFRSKPNQGTICEIHLQRLYP